MSLQVVLVIVLGAKEGFEGYNLGDNFPRVDLGGIELLDVRGGDALLFLAGIKDGGAILRAIVGSLAIELRWVMSHGEKNHQNLTIGNLRWVKRDAHGFRMASAPPADHF